MKGSAIVYGHHTWETLVEIKEDIYNEFIVKETIKDPKNIYIDI